MKFEIYCDEAYPDLFSSRKSNATFLTIGSLWLKADDRSEIKEAIHKLRDQHHIGREFKWRKVSPSKADFYLDLVNFFFDCGDKLRFRCIAIDQTKVDLIRYHQNDQELGFYKFYYQMLHHWILDFNEYAVFCDYKKNRVRSRMHALARCLQNANLSSRILGVQSIRSEESVLIQLADFLLGAASARLNSKIAPHTAKENIIGEIERRLGHKIGHTCCGERKFNVFVIDLGGGW